MKIVERTEFDEKLLDYIGGLDAAFLSRSMFIKFQRMMR